MPLYPSPKVVIGLPVYNGENYLEPALDSILGQTFSDFRLIIGDNASTDATPEICRRYGAQDRRIVYHRHSENIGAARNYNFVYQPDGAPYFKWAAHDDELAPEFLAKTVALLDANPMATVAHSRSHRIDQHGDVVGDYDAAVSLRDETPAARFWRTLWANYMCEVFGLMRTDAIDNTYLHGSYVGSDRNLMVELLFQGPIVYADEYLFRRRDHPECFVLALSSLKDRQKWFDPSVKFALPTQLSRTGAYVRSIVTMPMRTSDRFAAAGVLARWGLARVGEVVKRVDASREDRLDGIRSAYGVTSLKEELA